MKLSFVIFHCLLEYYLITLIYYLVGGTEEDHGSDRSVHALSRLIYETRSSRTNISANPKDKAINIVVKLAMQQQAPAVYGNYVHFLLKLILAGFNFRRKPKFLSFGVVYSKY